MSEGSCDASCPDCGEDLELPEEAIADVETAAKLVSEFFGGDAGKTALWFILPNPLLGMLSPAEMVWRGRSAKLLAVIRDQLAENEPPKPFVPPVVDVG